MGIEDDGYSVNCLRKSAENVAELYSYYESFERFLHCPQDDIKPALINISSSLNEEFDEFNIMIEDFIGQLEHKKHALTCKISDSIGKVVEQTKWWEATNIFSHDVSNDLLKQMLSKSPPDDPNAYGSYIKDMMASMSLRLLDSSFQSSVLRFRDEIMRVAAMLNGNHIALELLIDLQLRILRSGHDSFPDVTQTRLNSQIYESIDEVLEQAALGDAEFANVANACRRVRECMQARPCGYDSQVPRNHRNNACYYNILVLTLDTLQRHAYFEVRSNIRLALRSRLPAELVQLIFEHTMEAEGIGSDPRIIVDIADGPDPITRKCRFPCEHDQRQLSRVNGLGYGFYYVSGAMHKETLPNFPHSVDSYWELCVMETAAKFPAKHRS